jgi:hypothetical protein
MTVGVNRSQTVKHGVNHKRRGPDPAIVDDLLQTFTAVGTISTFTGVSRWYPPMAGTIDFVHAGLGSAPSGGSVSVQVNANGTAVGTVSIASGTFFGTFTPAPSSFGTATFFTVDVASGGTALGAKNLVVQFWGEFR